MNRRVAGAGVFGTAFLALAVLVARMPAVALPDVVSGRAADDCVMTLAAPWIAGGKTYRVFAAASGSSCTGANVTLTMRDPAGRLLMTFASAAADLPLLFGEVATRAAMTVALTRWIAQTREARSTRDLPGWDADKQQPAAGRDMQFQPEPLISRTDYMERRRAGQPMFCFLQGAESEACYAIDGKSGVLTLIGTMTIPG